jgi:hypothetical protein
VQLEKGGEAETDFEVQQGKQQKPDAKIENSNEEDCGHFLTT